MPLLRHRYDPNNPAVRRVLDRPRDVHMSIDARLQVQVADILRQQLQQAKQDQGRGGGARSGHRRPAGGGQLSAAAGYAAAMPRQPADRRPGSANPYLDRARYGLYPPGSTFKVVTAMAALRKDPALAHKTYECIRLPDGRVGNYIKGSKRPIRDDIQDTDAARHGGYGDAASWSPATPTSRSWATYDVGAESLFDTAKLLGIAVASPLTAAQLRKSLPQSSYGQGQVVASPFQMARVAATVANGGAMPQGRWITDETNARTSPPRERCCPPRTAATLGKFMREVVTGGTGRKAARQRADGGQDRHGRAGRRALARLVHRVRAVWKRGRARSPSPSWWRMEYTAARQPRRRRRRSSTPRSNWD